MPLLCVTDRMIDAVCACRQLPALKARSKTCFEIKSQISGYGHSLKCGQQSGLCRGGSRSLTDPGGHRGWCPIRSYLVSNPLLNGRNRYRYRDRYRASAVENRSRLPIAIPMPIPKDYSGNRITLYASPPIPAQVESGYSQRIPCRRAKPTRFCCENSCLL